MIKTFKAQLMGIIGMLFINCFYFSSLTAQINSDSLQAIQLLQDAESLATQQQFTASSIKTIEAANAFQQLNYWDQWVSCYKLIFYNGYDSNDFPAAISILKRDLHKAPKDRPAILAQMNYFLGLSHELAGDIFSASAYYETSLPYFTIAKDTASLIRIYGGLGITYTQQGDYTKAVNYLKRSTFLARLTKDSTSLGDNLYNLGKAYFYNKDLTNAQKSYAEAKSLNSLGVDFFNYLKAEIQLEQGAYSQAIISIKQSIRQTRQFNENSLEVTAEPERLLGEIYLRNNQPNLALKLFQKILPYYQSAPNHRELGKLYILIAEAQSEAKQYEQALATYQTALQAFLPDFKPDHSASNPNEALWSKEIWLMEIFRGKGHCFWNKYQIDQNEEWIYLAEKQYASAVNFIQNVKLNFETTEAKLSLGSYTHPFYEDLIKVKLKLFEATQKEKYKEEAFHIVQTANAFVLRALLTEQEALDIAKVSQDSIRLLKDLRKQIILITTQIKKSPKSEIDSLQSTLSEINAKQQQLKKSIEYHYPDFARLRNDLKVATSQQIQDKLDHSTLFIKYFLGEKKLYSFSISHSTFNIDTIALPDHFDQLILRYRRAISDLDFISETPKIAERDYLQSAHELYKILLKKPLNRHSQNRQIQRLSITADGILNTIPFQALLLQKSKSWPDPSHLLIAKYAVSYNYFSKMILDDYDPQNSKGGFVSFGIEFDDYTLKHLEKIAKDSIKNEAILENLRAGKFSSLPFSDNEARDIAELMHGTPWLNEEATKLTFLENTADANIIHLATHSILDQNNPKQSALIFTKRRDKLDNLLRLEEIYNLRLKASLIVLSACNTGIGQGKKGEGLNSLARAFRFAGIPSITATFWSIPDEASKKIMQLYYQFLKEGFPKDIALQKAQLEYLSNDQISSPVFRLPVYWAAWMPVGDNRAIDVERTNYFFYALLFFVGFLLIGWFLSRGKSKSI